MPANRLASSLKDKDSGGRIGVQPARSPAINFMQLIRWSPLHSAASSPGWRTRQPGLDAAARGLASSIRSPDPTHRGGNRVSPNLSAPPRLCESLPPSAKPTNAPAKNPPTTVQKMAAHFDTFAIGRPCSPTSGSPPGTEYPRLASSLPGRRSRKRLHTYLSAAQLDTRQPKPTSKPPAPPDNASPHKARPSVASPTRQSPVNQHNA